MSKVTMQDIANSLNISRATVCKAFNNHDGISPRMKDIVFDKAKELGYFKFEEKRFEGDKTISLIVSRPDSSTFWTNIVHRMAQELANHNINLLYTYMPTSYSKDFTLPAILRSDTIKGAIVLNISDENILKEINSLTFPKVFLDTVPNISDQDLNGDLVLLEGFSTISKITESIIKRGITNIGFIGDIHYAKTNLDRYLGYKSCINKNGINVNKEFIFTDSIDIFSYKQVITNYLDSLPTLPEAFVCISDFMAHFLKEYFTEHQDRIPKGIILTGYDGSKEYYNVDNLITTAKVDTTLLGNRLAIQIMYRMEHVNAPYELIFVKPEIVYHDSIIYN